MAGFKCKHWTILFGVGLLFFPLGFPYFWGNLSIYTLSYIVSYDNNKWGVNSPWTLQIWHLLLYVTLPTTGFLHRCFGKRAVVFIGMILFCGAYFLTYWTIQRSLLLMSISFGVISGAGVALLLGTGLQYIMETAESSVGLQTAIVKSAIIIGSIPINQLVTLYINPTNQSPDIKVGPSTFFSQKDVLDKVPNTYLIIGCISIVFQTAGFLILKEKKRPQNLSNISSEENYQSMLNLEDNADDRGTGSQLDSVTNHSNERREYTPGEMVRTRDFYILLFSVMFGHFGLVSINRYYKAYGLTFIKDDFALTSLGNGMALVFMVMNIVWGVVIDKYGSKLSLILYFSSTSFFMLCFYFSPKIHPGVYYVITLLLCGTGNPLVTIYAVVTAKIFGREYFATNFGVLMSSIIITSIGSVAIYGVVLVRLGWFYLFALCSLFDLLSLIGVACLRHN